MAEKYSIRLTDVQLAILSEATDMLSRIYLGQLDVAAPYDAVYQGDRGFLAAELRKLGKEISGMVHGSYGIHSPEVPEKAKISFDMYRTFRHRLAWDRNPEGGIYVQYDDPKVGKTSKHPLPRIDCPNFACMDCQVDTSKIGEFYMVESRVWKQATGKNPLGMLCIGCLEERLGRKLISSDFRDCPLNHGKAGCSQRLQVRKGNTYYLTSTSKELRNLWQAKVEDGIFLARADDRCFAVDPWVVDPTPEGLRLRDGSYLPLREEDE